MTRTSDGCSSLSLVEMEKMNSSMRRIALVCLALFVGSIIFGARPAHAQTDDICNAADTVRRTLFSAQAAILGGDSAEAISQTNAAFNAYKQTLNAPILAAAPELASSLNDA